VVNARWQEAVERRCSVGDFLASLRGYNMYDRIVLKTYLWLCPEQNVGKRSLRFLFLTLVPDVTVHLCSCTHISVYFS